MCQYDKEGKLKYSKGIIDGQNVLPFHFEAGELIDDDLDELLEPTVSFDLLPPKNRARRMLFQDSDSDYDME